MTFLKTFSHFIHRIYGDIVSISKHIIIYFPECYFGRFIRRKMYEFLLKDNMGKSSHIPLGVRIKTKPRENIKIGENLRLGCWVVINPSDSFGVLIGKNVCISEGTFIRAASHQYADPLKSVAEQGHCAKEVFTKDGQRASIIIEDNVWIAAHCVILSGAKIGKGSIISAGSVVASEIPEYSLVAGNPSRVVGNLKTLNLQSSYKNTS